MTMISRRGALIGGGAMMLTGASGALAARPGVPLWLRGLQLYTVRALIAKDLPGTLHRIATIGYRDVETAGLAGHTLPEWQSALHRAGLRVLSSHIALDDLRKDASAAFAQCRALGARHAIVPWTDEADRGDWTAVGRQLNAWAKDAAKAGLRLGYHNHEFEFEGSVGQRPFDLLVANTDPQLVDFELDVYWAAFAGADPAAEMRRYPGRVRLLHLKDKRPGAVDLADPDGAQVPVGQGTIDFRTIIAEAIHHGIQAAFVEADKPADPLANITASSRFLKRL